MPATRAPGVAWCKRVLVVSPHSSYRTTAFLNAAAKLGVELLFASHGEHSVVSAYTDGLHVDLNNHASALRAILQENQRHPFAAVIGTEDATTELAALVAQNLGLPHNPSAAVRIAGRKDLARERLARHGIPVPQHKLIDLGQPLSEQAAHILFPCVLKPLSLSASRGVIRADNIDQFVRACHRIGRLLMAERIEHQSHLLAEEFIDGAEVAVEGMLTGGNLEVLTIFDKPDPLDGPYFEETYYIMPSRLAREIQVGIRQLVGRACTAYGLREGPIHAECRINRQGIWILEVAARTIGGLCSRLLQYGTGRRLEELVIANAMGMAMEAPEGQSGGAGVLMIPTPAAGILRRVEGLVAAQNVPGIEEVTILVREGYKLVPWPEGSQYFGFIFASAHTPGQAEVALRRAHAELNIVIAPFWNIEHRCAESTSARVV